MKKTKAKMERNETSFLEILSSQNSSNQKGSALIAKRIDVCFLEKCKECLCFNYLWFRRLSYAFQMRGLRLVKIETLIRLFYGYDLAPLIKMINLNLFGKNSKKFLESLENDLKINPGRWF